MRHMQYTFSDMKKSESKTALVLGGTTPHIELIQQLKKIGYYTILIDYLENPPAKKYADLHIKESTLDADTVISVAKQCGADLVISACIDQANSVCCYVAEKLNLPHPYSFETSLLVTVKSKMKEIMTLNSIPTSWFYSAENVEQIPWEDVHFPAVIKPVDCNSSKGVRKANDISEAKLYFSEAIKLSRSKEALIEGYVAGTEIQVDCYSNNSETEVILIREKKQINRELAEEMNSQGSILPSPTCVGLEQRLQEIGSRIADAFGLKNTPFFYQAIVDDNRNVYVLELASRVGGGLSYYLLKEIAGFDSINAVINSYLGKSVEIKHNRSGCYYSTNLLYMNEGVFDHIEGLSEAKEKGLIKESFIFKEKGFIMDGLLRSGNRIGAFIVEADSVEEIMKKESDAYSLIRIIDINGKSQMKRWRK